MIPALRQQRAVLLTVVVNRHCFLADETLSGFPCSLTLVWAKPTRASLLAIVTSSTKNHLDYNQDNITRLPGSLCYHK
jgi:hypothetical protein